MAMQAGLKAGSKLANPRTINRVRQGTGTNACRGHVGASSTNNENEIQVEVEKEHNAENPVALATLCFAKRYQRGGRIQGTFASVGYEFFVYSRAAMRAMDLGVY